MVEMVHLRRHPQGHLGTKRGEEFQNTYLVVTVGYLIDFRFVVLFVFQAFFSRGERTEHKKPSNSVAVNNNTNEGSGSAATR